VDAKLTIFFSSFAEHFGILTVLLFLRLLGRSRNGKVVLVIVHDALLLGLRLGLLVGTGILVGRLRIRFI